MDIIQEALHQLRIDDEKKEKKQISIKRIPENRTKLTEAVEDEVEPKVKQKFTRHRAKKIPFADLWEQVYASLTDSADNDEYDALGDLCGKGHYDVYSVRSDQDIKPGYDGITVVDINKEDLHNRPTADYDDKNVQKEIETEKAKFDNFEWAKHIAEVYGLDSELSKNEAEFTIFVPIREIPREDLLNANNEYKESGIIKENYAYSLIEIATPKHLNRYTDGTEWNVTKDKWNKWAGENALLYVLLNRKDPEEKFLIVSWPEEDDVVIYDKDNVMQAPGDIIEHTTNRRLQDVMANWLTELGIISYHPEAIEDAEYRTARAAEKEAEREASRIRAQEKHKAKVAAQKAAKEAEEQSNESLEEDEIEEDEEVEEDLEQSLTEDLVGTLPVTPLGEATVHDYIENHVEPATRFRPPTFFKLGYLSELGLAAEHKHADIHVYKCSEQTVYTGAPYENLKATKAMRKETGKEASGERTGFSFQGDDAVVDKIGIGSHGDQQLQAYTKKGTHPRSKFFKKTGDNGELEEITRQEAASYLTNSGARNLLGQNPRPENPAAEGASIHRYKLNGIYMVGNLGHSVF